MEKQVEGGHGGIVCGAWGAGQGGSAGEHLDLDRADVARPCR